MEATKDINLTGEGRFPLSTDFFPIKPTFQREVNEGTLYYDDTSPSTGVSLEAERISFKEQIKNLTLYHKYSPEKAELITDILDASDGAIETHKNELQEILRAAQSGLEIIVEFKGRVVAIDEEAAEITIYEEGRNVTYSSLDSAYLTDIGLSQGDSFILTIVNDNGIEVPIFKQDKVTMEKIEKEIGPKSEKTQKEAMESQKDLDELYLFIKHNEPKQ